MACFRCLERCYYLTQVYESGEVYEFAEAPRVGDQAHPRFEVADSSLAPETATVPQPLPPAAGDIAPCELALDMRARDACDWLSRPGVTPQVAAAFMAGENRSTIIALYKQKFNLEGAG